MALPKEKFIPVNSTDISRTAEKANIPYANLRAVIEKESAGIAGVVIDGLVEPLIRFEGHIFDRSLSPVERSIARKLGLSSPKALGVKNPSRQDDRQKLLLRAANVNRDAAYEACSWGFGQIMGFHWRTLGLKDVHELVAMARSGQTGQATLMVMFLKKSGLDDDLRNGRWASFARGYNGPNFRKNNYDVAIAKLAEKFGGAQKNDIVRAPAPDGMLRLGAQGARVREVQALLRRAGANVKEDGDFGTSTRDAVKAFQLTAELTADGVVGPETIRRLNEYRTSAADKVGVQPMLSIPAVQKGLGAVVAAGVALPNIAASAGLSPEAIDTAKAGLEQAAAQIVASGVESVFLDCLVTGLTIGTGTLGVVGALYAVYGVLKRSRTIEA